MIRAHNLSRQFDHRGIAGIHQLSFSLEKGKIMGVLGPNGSGKTTLLNILAGKIKPDQGSFELDGGVSFYPRNEELQDMNVQKFLVSSVSIDIDDEKKIQLARDLADTFEFTFQLRQKLSELSSGQKQKVLLSRELINRPTLLLMDEPFTHLDPFTRKDILRGLFKYIHDQRITVLWVTHDLEEAYKFSDIISVMNFGKFEQTGSPVELIRKPKNLFVAKFLGYRNFISRGNEILVIPDSAWMPDAQGQVFVIDEIHATRQGIEYVMSSEGRRFYRVSLSQDKLLERGAQVRLSPSQKDSFLIPL